MDLLQIIKFLLEFLTVIELTPSTWFEQGFNLFEVLLISWCLTFLRVMIEIAVIKFGFNLGELVWRGVVKLLNFILPHQAGKMEQFTQRSNGRRDRLIKRLKGLGNVGLFLLGLLPIPYSGALGAIIYNLEQIHRPFYKINNLSFICLLSGWIVKMTVFVWLAS